MIELDRTILYIQRSYLNKKIESYLAEYLVVVVCGVLEDSIESIISEWSLRFRSKEITNFLEHTLYLDFRNPEMDKILTLLGAFNQAWVDELTSSADYLYYKTAIDSIVRNKNDLAHIGTATITLQEVKNYYDRIKKFLEKLDEIILADER